MSSSAVAPLSGGLFFLDCLYGNRYLNGFLRLKSSQAALLISTEPGIQMYGGTMLSFGQCNWGAHFNSLSGISGGILYTSNPIQQYEKESIWLGINKGICAS